MKRTQEIPYQKLLIMIIVTLLLCIIILFVLLLNFLKNSSSDDANSACNIESIENEAQYVTSFNEALSLMKYHCGEPDSDIGSGLSIPQWNLSINQTVTLTYQGLVSRDENYENHITKSTNYVVDNIYGDYEVSYHDSENDQYLWLGTLRLTKENKYRYYELSKFSDEVRDKIQDNFIFQRPTGTFEIELSQGYKSTERLENLEDNDTYSVLTFSDGSGKLVKRLLRVDTEERQVYFHSREDELEVIRVMKSWNNNYYAPNITRVDYEITIPDMFMDTDSHGEPVELEPCTKLLQDVQFLDESGNLSFALWEPTKVSEPPGILDGTENWMKDKMKIFLPQAATNVQSEVIKIKEYEFTKLTYDIHELPDMGEYLSTEFAYGIELENKYVFITHVTIGDTEMEDILLTFRLNSRGCITE